MSSGKGTNLGLVMFEHILEMLRGPGRFFGLARVEERSDLTPGLLVEVLQEREVGDPAANLRERTSDPGN